jgi:hypothetical protein
VEPPVTFSAEIAYIPRAGELERKTYQNIPKTRGENPGFDLNGYGTAFSQIGQGGIMQT